MAHLKGAGIGRGELDGGGSQGDVDEGIVGINVHRWSTSRWSFSSSSWRRQDGRLAIGCARSSEGSLRAPTSRWSSRIELYANGEIAVDQKKLPNDDALFPMRRTRTRGTPIFARSSRPTHVRISVSFHVLDLLKQSGVTKIAFGVTPIAAEPWRVTAPAHE